MKLTIVFAASCFFAVVLFYTKTQVGFILFYNVRTAMLVVLCKIVRPHVCRTILIPRLVQKSWKFPLSGKKLMNYSSLDNSFPTCLYINRSWEGEKRIWLSWAITLCFSQSFLSAFSSIDKSYNQRFCGKNYLYIEKMSQVHIFIDELSSPLIGRLTLLRFTCTFSLSKHHSQQFDWSWTLYECSFSPIASKINCLFTDLYLKRLYFCLC